MNESTQRWRIFALLVLVSLFVRLPFFFSTDIDWDEGTYLLMGQAILDGDHLYVDLWDNKPPLLYVAFAGAIAMSGKTLFGVRLFAALLVAVTAYLVFEITTTLRDRTAGLWAAMIWILLASLLPSGMAMMTEHVAMVPFTASLLVLVKRDWTFRWLVLAGVLMAAACMVRTNLAIVAVVLALLIPLRHLDRGVPSMLRALFGFASGGVIVVVASIFPMIPAGRFDLLWRTIVSSGLAFSSSQLSWMDVLSQHGVFLWQSLVGIGDPAWVTSALGWFGTAAGIVLMSCNKAARPESDRIVTLALIVAAVTTAATIAISGVANAHYLIQLAPFAATAAGIFWSWLGSRLRIASALSIVLAGTILTSSVAQYALIVDRVRNGEPAYHGAAYDIAQILKANDLDKGSMLFMLDHIALWLLDAKPILGSMTHPSAISRDYLLTAAHGTYTSPVDEMKRVLALRPDVIVTVHPLTYLENTSAGREAQRLLDKDLSANYRLLDEVDGREIHVRTGL